MPLPVAVVNSIFQQLHYQILSESLDCVLATNPLGQERQFMIKLLNEGTSGERYFIHATNLTFLTVDLADEVFPVEFEFETDNIPVTLRDYYYKPTDKEIKTLTIMYQ